MLTHPWNTLYNSRHPDLRLRVTRFLTHIFDSERRQLKRTFHFHLKAESWKLKMRDWNHGTKAEQNGMVISKHILWFSLQYPGYLNEITRMENWIHSPFTEHFLHLQSSDIFVRNSIKDTIDQHILRVSNTWSFHLMTTVKSVTFIFNLNGKTQVANLPSCLDNCRQILSPIDCGGEFSGNSLWIPSSPKFITSECVSQSIRLKSVVFENDLRLEQITV
jgi:hypothetical protein